jgi:hypothetical protein
MLPGAFHSDQPLGAMAIIVNGLCFLKLISRTPMQTGERISYPGNCRNPHRHQRLNTDVEFCGHLTLGRVNRYLASQSLFKAIGHNSLDVNFALSDRSCCLDRSHRHAEEKLRQSQGCSRTSIIVSVIGRTSVCLIAITLAAVEDPFVGKWKLNLTKSTPPERIESLGGNGYKITLGDSVNTILADGNDQAADFGRTLSLKEESPNVWRAIWKRNGKVIDQGTWTVQADGNTMVQDYTV